MVRFISMSRCESLRSETSLHTFASRWSLNIGFRLDKARLNSTWSDLVKFGRTEAVSLTL